MSEGMILLLVKGIWETLVMTFASGFLGFLIGLPVGVLLYITRSGQIADNKACTGPCPCWSISSARFRSLSYWCG